MQKNLYVDIDEEITSVVDRLRKTKSEEVVAIVPKNALILQSVVNLKLLKKEAERAHRQVMIVTQDDLGRVLAEKAGILVQDNFEEFEESEDAREKKVEKKKGKPHTKARKTLLIGSDSFYEEAGAGLSSAGQEPAEKRSKETIVNRELVTARRVRSKTRARNKKKHRVVTDIITGSAVSKKEGEKNRERKTRFSEKEELDGTSGFFEKITEKQEQSIKKFFSDEEKNGRNKTPKIEKSVKEKDLRESKKAWKYFAALIILTLVAGAVLVIFQFFPKVTVAIIAKNKAFSLNMEVTADINTQELNAGSGLIPARRVAIEDSVVGKFEATGTRDFSDKKARGMVKIYNEYSSTPQPLVATTRLLADNGILFRLTNDVTVPGMEGTNPGILEAEAVADQSGAEYNIGPARFSIPGLKGSPKFDKFYALSEFTMTGGGTNGEKIKVVSGDDMKRAKESLEEKAGNASRNSFEELLEPGEMVLASAITGKIERFIPSQTAGAATESFELEGKVSRTTLAFGEDELYAAVIECLQQSYQMEHVSREDVGLEFGKPRLDAEKGLLIMPVDVIYNYLPQLDLEEVKNDIAGKTGDEVKMYFEGHEDVERIEINYWPFRFGGGSIPREARKLRIEVKAEE